MLFQNDFVKSTAGYHRDFTVWWYRDFKDKKHVGEYMDFPLEYYRNFEYKDFENLSNYVQLTNFSKGSN